VEDRPNFYELRDNLKSYPAAEMQAYPVSSLVNSWENEGPDLIAAITPTEQLSF
jgi:putative SOS response-associated peptidase YedK